MLNTIYEEFDFESKIAELKRKKIKIKRVIKKLYWIMVKIPQWINL